MLSPRRQLPGEIRLVRPSLGSVETQTAHLLSGLMEAPLSCPLSSRLTDESPPGHVPMKAPSCVRALMTL